MATVVTRGARTVTDSDTELREDVTAVIQRHDPDPAALRDLADSIERLADKWEALEGQV